MSDGQFDLSKEDEEMLAAEAALADAQRRVMELRERNRPKVLEEVRKKIQSYQFTADELGLTAPTKPSAAVKAPAAAKSTDASRVVDRRSIVRPKYIGPAGQPWSGRGKIPLWMKEEIEERGRTKEDFLVPEGKGNEETT